MAQQQGPIGYGGYSVPYYAPRGSSASAWTTLPGVRGVPGKNVPSKQYSIDEYSFDPAVSAWMNGGGSAVLAAPRTSAAIAAKLAIATPVVVPPVATVGVAAAAAAVVSDSPRKPVSADEFTQVGNSGKRWPRAIGSSKKSKKSAQNDIEDEISGQNLYKTELCRSFEETGTCRYGSKCQFAHGRDELRPVLRHPKYKTEVCKTFHTIGTCPYGKRCRFIHSTASPNGTVEPENTDAEDDDDDDNDNNNNNNNNNAAVVATPAAPVAAVVPAPVVAAPAHAAPVIAAPTPAPHLMRPHVVPSTSAPSVLARESDSAWSNQWPSPLPASSSATSLPMHREAPMSRTPVRRSAHDAFFASAAATAVGGTSVAVVPPVVVAPRAPVPSEHHLMSSDFALESIVDEDELPGAMHRLSIFSNFS